MPEEALTAKQAATYLDISVTEFNRRVQRGDIKPLPSVRIRGRKFSKEDLDRYKEEFNKAK